MTRGSTLTILATTRSAEFGNLISSLLAKVEDVRVDTRIGDLPSLTGDAAEALERADVLLVDIDAGRERAAPARPDHRAAARPDRDPGDRPGPVRPRRPRPDPPGRRRLIPQPFEHADLLDAIATARVKLRQARMDGKLGKVIAVSRAKGGMGASTLAAHIALALCEKRHRREPDKEVALLDLDLQFGDLALMLDLEPNNEMVAMIRDPGRLDGALLRASMTRHGGVACSCCRRRARSCCSTRCLLATAVKLIELARQEFEYVVLDLPLALRGWLYAALQHVDQLVLVSQLNVAAIRQTRRWLDFLKEEGLDDLPVSLVLNRYVWRLSERARLRQAYRALDHPIDHYVPDDAALALEAINRGTPLFELRRRAKLCRSLRQVTAACVTMIQQREQAAIRLAAHPPKREDAPMFRRFTRHQDHETPAANGAAAVLELMPRDQRRTEQDEQLRRWLDLKTRLHERLLEELNLSAIEKVAKADLRREVATIVNEMLTGEATALNAKEFNLRNPGAARRGAGPGPARAAAQGPDDHRHPGQQPQAGLRRAVRRARALPGAVQGRAPPAAHHRPHRLRRRPPGRRVPALGRRPPRRRLADQRDHPALRARRAAALDPQVLARSRSRSSA